MTEKTYSAKDLSGREVLIDRTFSESEVDLFSDLFSDFWEENEDNYSDLGSMDAIDIAYSEFFDAYSCGEYSDKKVKLGKNTGRGLVALAGAGAGYAASNVLNAKDKQKRKDILLKMKQGRASSTEINELKSLKTKINTRKALSTVGGAALATAGTVGLSKLKQKQNKKKEMESNYSQEDLFADEFANYFVTNVDHYGDTDAGMDEAYNDFVSSRETENETEEVYSEEDQLIMDNFSAFYNDVSDLYEDNDQGIDDAFNDFLEIEASMDNYTEEVEVTEEEYSEQELAFIDYYTTNEDTYGDNADLAYSDFMEVYSEVENEFETEYSEVETTEEVAETAYSAEVQEIANDFADFYSELGDVYGDDLEMAFDDYSDALENLANEDTYGDDAYAMSGNRKKMAKNAGMGAAAGLGVGLLAGAATDPNSKARKALKAKVKAGNATDSDKARLAELKKARRNRLMKAGGAGAVGGAAVGASAQGVKAGMAQMKSNKKANKADFDAKFGSKQAALDKAKKAGKIGKGKLSDMQSKLDDKKGAHKDLHKKTAGVGQAVKNAFSKKFSDTTEIKNTEDRNFSAEDNTATKSYVLGLIK